MTEVHLITWSAIWFPVDFGEFDDNNEWVINEKIHRR